MIQMNAQRNPVYHKLYIGWSQATFITSGIISGRIVEDQKDLNEVIATINRQDGWPIMFAQWADVSGNNPVMFVWQRSHGNERVPQLQFGRVLKKYKKFWEEAKPRE